MRTFLIFIFLLSTTVSAQDENYKTGVFKLSGTSAQILGETDAKVYAKILKPDEPISWQIYVPENYDPSKPSGTLVFYRGWDKSDTIEDEIQTLFTEKNMIYISPIVDTALYRDMEHGEWDLQGILSVIYLQSAYAINTDRIYVGGHAIGCVTASISAPNFPNIYKGAFFSDCGPQQWGRKQAPNTDLMKQNRYYFISSDEGHSARHMYRTMKLYNDYGIDNTYHAEKVEIDFSDPFPIEHMEAALEFLDRS